MCCSSSSPYSCLLTLPHRFFVTIFFAVHFVYKSCQTFRKKKREGYSADMQKKYNRVEKQKRTICVFKCSLNCQWASLKFCGHLNSIVQRGPLFASCRTNTISVKLRNVFRFFVPHRRHMSSEIMFVVTEGCFFLGTPKNRNGAFFCGPKKRARIVMVGISRTDA